MLASKRLRAMKKDRDFREKSDAVRRGKGFVRPAWRQRDANAAADCLAKGKRDVTDIDGKGTIGEST